MGVSITEIVIPKSVVTISDFAFANCSSLRKIEFTDDGALRVIGESCFR